LTGYQHTAVLKAAIELDLFTLIGSGTATIDALAARTHAAPRGLRALCDHLVVDGFLSRAGERYGLTPTAALLLDRNSPGFLGAAIEFIGSPMIMDAFSRLTDSVRRGGTTVPDDGTLSAENPVWVQFARAMAGIAGMSAMLLGNLLDVEHA